MICDSWMGTTLFIVHDILSYVLRMWQMEEGRGDALRCTAHNTSEALSFAYTLKSGWTIYSWGVTT